MTQQVKIVRMWDETSEIRCFELVPCEPAVRCLAEPGSHIDVHVKDQLVRQYSLFNGPEDTDRFFIGVKKELVSRGGSHGMHALADGATLTISSPKNNFPLSEDPGRAILMAGGIGITPLLSMARHLAAQGRLFELHLFARSEEHAPFKQMFGSMADARVHTGLVPPELDGVITTLLRGREDDAQVYACGPKPFMDLVVSLAQNEGWGPDRIHLEYFTVDVPVPAEGDTAIEVVLAKSGKTIIVAADQTITDAIMAAGLDILTSCEQGVCGTCLTTVLEGEPDHRDHYLNPAERGSGKLMLPCVSRCHGKRLVLDI